MKGECDHRRVTETTNKHSRLINCFVLFVLIKLLRMVWDLKQCPR